MDWMFFCKLKLMNSRPYWKGFRKNIKIKRVSLTILITKYKFKTRALPLTVFYANICSWIRKKLSKKS